LSAQIAPSRTEQAAKSPKIVQGCTVLLAEDNEALREMVKSALVDMGIAVLQARDGVEAVETFKIHNDEVSCLICDLTMPRMDGWGTISALRAIRHDLPVILASGYDEASAMAGEHPELPDFFLTKPYDLHKLKDMIGQAMERRGNQ
ncbi:MAG: response regulator, partial [Lentisphaerae bacterium]|nr:response regulator [Lentisphaerota bacterium]